MSAGSCVLPAELRAAALFDRYPAAAVSKKVARWSVVFRSLIDPGSHDFDHVFRQGFAFAIGECLSVMWWHLDFGSGFLCDNQVQGAGHAAFRDDHGSESSPAHDAVVVHQVQAALVRSLASSVVAFNAVVAKYGLDIVGETHLTFAAENSQRQHAYD